jgi:hypothetical protein
VYGDTDTDLGNDTDRRHIEGSPEAGGSRGLSDVELESLRQAVKPTRKYGHSRHYGVVFVSQD